MTIGELLRTRRVELGLSLREVCRRAGLSHGALHFIETGRNKPREYNLKNICKVLGLDYEKGYEVMKITTETCNKPVLGYEESELHAILIHLTRYYDAYTIECLIILLQACEYESNKKYIDNFLSCGPRCSRKTQDDIIRGKR